MKNEIFNEIESHIEFISGILEGNKRHISNLEMWYERRKSDTNNQISRNEIQIYNDLKNRKYGFKNKENIENQRKEINDNLMMKKISLKKIN